MERKHFLKPICIILLFLLLFCLTACGEKYESIQAEYDGETIEGSILDSDNEGFHVWGLDKDGEKTELSGWEIEEPKELTRDSEETVTITYKDYSCDVNVLCSTSAVVELTVTYSGDTEEGTALDKSNTGFMVQAIHKNGEIEEIDDWSIKTPETLVADSETTITVVYENIEQDCKVKCSTHHHQEGAWETAEDNSLGLPEVKKCTICHEVLQTRYPDKPEPKEITVLSVNGFVMSCEEYAQHLYSYLEYEGQSITEITSTGFKIDPSETEYGLKFPKVELEWDKDDEDSRKDMIWLYSKDKYAMAEVIEPIIRSIDPEMGEDRIKEAEHEILQYLYHGEVGKYYAVGLHTGLCVVEISEYGGYHVVFGTVHGILG